MKVLHVWEISPQVCASLVLKRDEYPIYRKEQNCLIQPSRFGAQEQQEIISTMFSPRENEHLGCIHDHLIEETTTPFTDLTEYDVDWDELPIPWTETFGNGEMLCLERYLLKCPDFVFRLSITRPIIIDTVRYLTIELGMRKSFPK